MKSVELYGRVRRAAQIEGLSRREAARRLGIDPRMEVKMLVSSVPPGYRRGGAPKRSKLDPLIRIIDRLLEEDKSWTSKQRHTSKRIFERLRIGTRGAGGGCLLCTTWVSQYRALTRPS